MINYWRCRYCGHRIYTNELNAVAEVTLWSNCEKKKKQYVCDKYTCGTQATEEGYSPIFATESELKSALEFPNIDTDGLFFALMFFVPFFVLLLFVLLAMSK
jgi:hypothetical protein